MSDLLLQKLDCLQQQLTDMEDKVNRLHTKIDRYLTGEYSKGVSTAKAAKLIGVSQRTIQLAIKTGDIKASCNRGKYLIPASEMKRLLTDSSYAEL